MEVDGPRPVVGRPALLLPEEGDHRAEIAVADLHLGLGYARGGPVGFADETARSMADELVATCREATAHGIVVAGDSKHPIVGAPPPVARILFDFFSTLLAEQLTVRVILGNHDVGLARHLPREVEVVPARGLRRGTVGLFHGHGWPSPRVLRAPVVVAGHLHPGFRLAAGGALEAGKRRCWVRVELAPPTGRKGGRHRIEARHLIVLPAFNPVSGIESLNKGPPSEGRTFLVHRFLAPGRARAYLLDGTDLGRLPSWSSTRPRRRRPV